MWAAIRYPAGFISSISKAMHKKSKGSLFGMTILFVPDAVTASLAPGKYDYAIERGPEYLRKTGQDRNHRRRDS